MIFAAGTGNPFFTTDTAAALRSAEIGADMVLKATQVDGVFTADPKKDPNAKMYKSLTFDEAHSEETQEFWTPRLLRSAAIKACRSESSTFISRCAQRVVLGEDEGTLVHV